VAKQKAKFKLELDKNGVKGCQKVGEISLDWTPIEVFVREASGGQFEGANPPNPKGRMEIGLGDDRNGVFGTLMHECFEFMAIRLRVLYSVPIGSIHSDPTRRLFVMDHGLYTECMEAACFGAHAIWPAIADAWAQRNSRAGETP